MSFVQPLSPYCGRCHYYRYIKPGGQHVSGSKAKAARRFLRQSSNGVSGKYVIEAEYPALTPEELAESANARLRKSRLAFKHAGSIVKPIEANATYDALIGRQSNGSHSSASKVDEWLAGWRMPNDQALPDVRTSLTTYVGFVASGDMPSSSSRLNDKVPYALVTSRFIDLCWQLTEILPIFMAQVVPSLDVRVGSDSRGLLFTHLGLTDDRREEAAELIAFGRDSMLSERITSAAIRWAIAHEMAHIHGSEPDLTDGYLRAERSYPNIAREQWEPKRRDLSSFADSVKSYKKEIACDILANRYVLDSPFAAHDIITQAIGALVAIEALIWDGWRLDGAKISSTHPSPSLRFQLVAEDWKQILASPATWARCEVPGLLAKSDFANMLAFDRWARGGYREHREGAVWGRDIEAELDNLHRVVPQGGIDHVYVQRPEGLHRVRSTD